MLSARQWRMWGREIEVNHNFGPPPFGPREHDCFQVAALLEALTEYWKAAEADGLTDDPTDDPDASIGSYGDGKPLAMTYGHIRRLRALLPQTGEGEGKNKIVAGAEDALAFAQGDDTRASVANVRYLTLEEQQTVSKALARSSTLIHKPAPMSEGERDTLSDLEICNLALSRIAAEPISSLDENSPAARHCLELYAPTLDNLLRCGTWPYRPLLANALSWRLAADLASALKNDVTRRHEAMAEFSRALLANQEARIAEKAIADALSKREDGTP